MQTIISLIAAEIEKNNYHLFAEVGYKDAELRLLIDTGASKSVLDSNKVQQYISREKLKKQHTQSVGLGAIQGETETGSLYNLRFGKAVIRRLDVAVLDLVYVNQTYKVLGFPEIDGVLGSDFLMKYKAVINYEKLVLKIRVG